MLRKVLSFIPVMVLFMVTITCVPVTSSAVSPGDFMYEVSNSQVEQPAKAEPGKEEPPARTAHDKEEALAIPSQITWVTFLIPLSVLLVLVISAVSIIILKDKQKLESTRNKDGLTTEKFNFNPKWAVFTIAIAVIIIITVILIRPIDKVNTHKTVVTGMDDKVEKNNKTTDIKREGPDKPIVLGFFQDGVDNEWKLTVSNSIKDSSNENGIDLQFTDAQSTQENQIKAIRKFIKDKVDVIAFTPIVSSGWETVLAEAKEAGIPVILVDRFVKVKDDSLWTAWIGNDQVEEGRKAARWLVEYMNIIGKGNGKINVVELEGAVGSEVAIERKTGFEEIIKNYPNYAIKMSLNCGFTRELGKNVMEEFLINDGHKIDVVFAQNDEMAIGAIEAIEEYGLRPGKDIIIVSIDAGKDAFKTMMAAKLNCTVECSPVMGPKLMEAVKDLVNGKKIPKKIYVPEDVFPMENAARIYPTRKY